MRNFTYDGALMRNFQRMPFTRYTLLILNVFKLMGSGAMYRNVWEGRRITPIHTIKKHSLALCKTYAYAGAAKYLDFVSPATQLS